MATHLYRVFAWGRVDEMGHKLAVPCPYPSQISFFTGEVKGRLAYIYIFIYLQILYAYIYIPVIHDIHFALIWTPFYFFSWAICLKSSAIDILGASSIGTGVGLSSIRSTNTLEIAFFVIVAFRSLMTYATLVSSITSLTSQLSKIKARWREMGWWTGIGDFLGP